MKKFTVMVWYTNGQSDWQQFFRLEEARAVFDRWMADIQSVHVVIE